MTCTKYDVMTHLRSLPREVVEEALYNALVVVQAYGYTEGYTPREVTKEYEAIEKLKALLP